MKPQGADGILDAQPDRPDALRSIKTSAIRAARWTVLGYTASNAVRFVGTVLVMAHLLPTAAFGIMGIVNIVRRGIEMLSDVGLGPCIIAHPRGCEDAFLQTAWTIQLVRGVLLWMIACVLAGPIAIFYGQPQLIELLIVTTFGLVIAGAASTGLHVLGRRMEAGKLALLNLGTQVVSTVVMVAVALVWPTVWAFVIGGLCGAMARVVISFALVPEAKMRFSWDREAAHQLLTFGTWILLSTALTYFGGHVDRIVLPKLLSLDLFGVFVVAYAIAEMPKDMINRLNAQVLMPAVANRNYLDREDLRQRLIRNRRPLLLVTAGAIAAAVVVADQVILLLLPDKWAEAAWMLPILLVGVWFALLSSTVHSILIGLGEPKWGTLGNFARMIAVAAALPVAHHFYGPYGAVIVVAMAAVPHYIAVGVGASRHGIGFWMQDLAHTAMFTALLAALVLGRYELGLGNVFAP